MAKLTKNEEYIVDMYVRYFGRAADAATIATYAEDKKTSVILKNIIADADAEKAELSKTEFVNNAFQNLFGRNATTKEMSKYYKVVDAGKDLPINSIVKSAAKNDKKVYDNKKAVALKYAELGGTERLDLSKISKGNTVDPNFLNTVTKAADLKAKIETLADNSGIPSSFDGKTFVLTEGVDTGKDFIGTNKGDLFVADNTGTKANASAADTLDGGKGVDTFKVYDAPASATVVGLQTLPTLKNIENVVIYNNQDTTLDSTKWDTVETLFLVDSIATTGIKLGEKVTTVNFEDIAAAASTQVVNFDKALTAATLGVNKVIDNSGATPAAIGVTVDGTALKTLTVDAYGKASNVNLAQTANTIETLNITGKANLTLGTLAAITTIKTVDGSKAQGNLTFSNTIDMTSIKTGSGNDTVTVAALVDSGETINLGAGNDKLVKGAAGSVATSTTTVIDGGAGIDSLDSALVTVGNAGVFANFETLSLTTAITTIGAALDMDLLTKSTITSIAKDNGAAIHFVKNVQKSQSLTINTNATAATTLVFKDVAGTADAYTINFAKDAAVVAAGTTVDAGTVTIAGIETININSTGATATTGNLITLVDANAKSIVVTGDKALTIAGGASLGTLADATNGLGVSTIDASASTAGITLAAATLANINTAWSGLTIKGGAGDDSIITGATTARALTIETGAGKDTINLTGATTATDKIIVNAGAGNDNIIVGAKGGTFTLGAGIDTINASAAVATGGTAATSVFTTITDIEKGDVIKVTTGNTLFAKADITGANSLDTALNAAAHTTAVTWFQYAGNTYIVDGAVANGALAANELVVKLNGLVDLGNSTISSGTDITIA